MSDLEQIRDALESAKTFLGQEILWKESNYVRGHGEKKYSELCVALSIIDRMIETPAPQGWSAIETAPKDGSEILLALWSGHPEHKTSFCWAINGHYKDGSFYSKDPMIGKLASPTHWQHITAPTPAPTEKVDYKQLKQLVFMWAADVNGAPLDSDICEIINIIRRTEKVEGIDGLFDAVSVEDLPPPNTDEECDNITKRYQSHEAIYGCSVSETLLEAARAYLKLQSGETEKVDLNALKLEVEKCFPSMNYTESSLVDVVIDHLSNTGRLR